MGLAARFLKPASRLQAISLMGKTFEQAQAISDEFVDLMQSKGKKAGDEQTLEDAVALAGVSQYPARIKCALLGWMAIKDASIQTQTK